MSGEEKLGALLGVPNPSPGKRPAPNPRKAAIRQLKRALDSEDEDLLGSALSVLGYQRVSNGTNQNNDGTDR